MLGISLSRDSVVRGCAELDASCSSAMRFKHEEQIWFPSLSICIVSCMAGELESMAAMLLDGTELVLAVLDETNAMDEGLGAEAADATTSAPEMSFASI